MLKAISNNSKNGEHTETDFHQTPLSPTSPCEAMLQVEFGIYSFKDIEERCMKELVNPKRFNIFLIVWSGSKEAECWIDNVQQMVPANTLLFIGPDRLVNFSKEISPDAQFIFFNACFYEHSPKDALFLQNNALFFDHNEIYTYTPQLDAIDIKRIVMKQLKQAFIQGKTSLYYDLARNMIEYLLIKAMLQKQGKSVKQKVDEDAIIAMKFKNLIQEYFVTQKSVIFYADQLNISARKLSKATEKTYGKNAKQLIFDKQLNEAKQLLINSPLSIKEISALLGYTEENNFSAFFSKHIHFSPREFRKMNQISSRQEDKYKEEESPFVKKEGPHRIPLSTKPTESQNRLFKVYAKTH